MSCFALFAFACFMMWNSTNEGVALFWGRIGLIAVIFFFPAYLHLTWVFPEVKKIGYALLLIYLPAIVFGLSITTDILLKGMDPYPWGGFYFSVGPAYNLFVIYISIYLFFGTFSLLKSRIQATGIIRKQVEFVLGGALLMIFIGLTTDVVPTLMDFRPILPSMTAYVIAPVSILFAYAITKYKLFVLPPITRFFIPAPEAELRTKPKLKLEEGRNYLIKEEMPLHSRLIFIDLIKHGIPGLWITSLSVKKAKKYGLRRTPTIFLVSERIKDETTLPPNRLDRGKALVLSYLGRVPGKSVVFVDCLKELIIVNGFEKTLDFIQYLGKICFEHNSNLIVRADPESFTKRQLAEIERALREREKVGVWGPGEVRYRGYYREFPR